MQSLNSPSLCFLVSVSGLYHLSAPTRNETKRPCHRGTPEPQYTPCLYATKLRARPGAGSPCERGLVRTANRRRPRTPRPPEFSDACTVSARPRTLCPRCLGAKDPPSVRGTQSMYTVTTQRVRVRRQARPSRPEVALTLPSTCDIPPPPAHAERTAICSECSV